LSTLSIAISVSVEGLELPGWEGQFRSAIAAAPARFGLAADIAGSGTFGSRRKRAVRVTSPKKIEGASMLEAFGIVLSALSLSVSAAQLRMDVAKADAASNPAAPALVYRIEGSEGVRELRLADAAMLTDTVLRECLEHTGTPTEIAVLANRQP